MKVLVTGGYGFIGSHVADRFHKEGHEVYIIDNLFTGQKKNIDFKHKGYVLSVEDEKCEEIFRSNKFDVVVHMAAQVSVPTSITNPTQDTESNVLGLVNMLNFSKKYQVSKFIYASSAAVYGEKTELPIKETDACVPISPYGISKWVGESYCKKWQEMYGLQTLGFRFSNVYGPRQDARGEGGVIATFISRIIAGQPLHVHGDGNQTRDYIYVEDVADAIFRASYSPLTGIYNLSTGTEFRVTEIVELLKAPQVEHVEKRPGDIERSVLDNTLIKRDLDWTPMYSIQEGLERTYRYFEQEWAKAEAAATAAVESSALKTASRHAYKFLIPYAENLLAFALTAWLTLSQQYSSYGAIDVKLFYITIMGNLYGNRQSILAVVLSIGLFLYQKLMDGREFISLLYDTDFFFQIAIYLFIGLVVGYSIDRKNAQIQNQEQKLEEMEGKYAFLHDLYNEVREVKEELQMRILKSGDSYGKIYSITKELESLEPEQVFHATVNVVRSIMNAPTVSIYTVNRSGTYLRLVAHSSVQDLQAPKSLKVADYNYIQAMLADGKVFVNKQLSAGAPLMCAPVYYRDQIAAVVAIDGLSFETFSLYHQNLFKVTTDLVSSALSKAFAFIEATENQRYVEGTPLLRPEAFQVILRSKQLAKEQNQTPYLLLRGKQTDQHFAEMSDRLDGMLRETDYIGLDEDHHLVVLLSNTSLEDANHVLNRFAQKGISLQVAEEEL
ncbi:NAD-dependent epimerase/dehydratase family protein [Brevibacillus panacihumi]|uniref:NAD-dependent epimerase/dehydratase family protein n=1 Tax=Brevibacillus panacihumi TaxID=497735 RepID=UPI003D20CADD